MYRRCNYVFKYNYNKYNYNMIARLFSHNNSVNEVVLKDKSLFKTKCYINGKWIDSNNVLEVINPANRHIIGTIPMLSSEYIYDAIEQANNAWKDWKDVSALKRGEILSKWGNLMLENEDDLAYLITAENGKLINEARGEVKYAASFLNWFAEEAPRMNGYTIPSANSSTRLITIKQPVGVVGAITPFNFPAAMLTRKIGAALAAGCTIVCKPSEETPFTAMAMCELAERAGVPSGVINMIHGDSIMIGDILSKSNIIRKITFTGSTRVGKLLMSQSANTVKRVSMELGGNAPFIIFDDTENIDRAVDGIIASKFRGSGQTCVCSNRIYVQKNIMEIVSQKLSEKVKQMKCGEHIGPLISLKALKKVNELLDDAVKSGANILCGGKNLMKELGGFYFEPTILTNVSKNCRILEEEIFGPIAPLVSFENENEVLQLANDTNAGLAAYVYTNNMKRAWKFAEKLEYGMVGINEPVISTQVAPFGGIKESGLGREGSTIGIDDYCEVKYICFGDIN